MTWEADESLGWWSFDGSVLQRWLHCGRLLLFFSGSFQLFQLFLSMFSSWCLFRHGWWLLHHIRSLFQHAWWLSHHIRSPFQHAWWLLHHTRSPFQHAWWLLHHTRSPLQHAWWLLHHTQWLTNRILRLGTSFIFNHRDWFDFSSEVKENLIITGSLKTIRNMIGQL